jgi:hypothetical protein
MELQNWIIKSCTVWERQGESKMLHSQFLRIRYVTVLLLMLVVAVSVDAFAATDEILNLGATNGTGVIKGYMVNNAIYVTNSDGDLATLEQVSFDLTPLDGAGRAANVYVEVVGNSNVWFPCDTGQTHDWDCPITATSAAEANTLNVVATDRQTN